MTARSWTITSAEQKPGFEYPAPPFTTSTLTQEASRKLGFSTERTMQAAQRLFQEGHISYHRTDSTTLSEKALADSAALGETRSVEFRIRRETTGAGEPAVEFAWIEMCCRALERDPHEGAGDCEVVAAMRDITRRKQIEAVERLAERGAVPGEHGVAALA